MARSRCGLLGVLNPFQQHHELVAAKPCNHVAGAHTTAEPGRHLDQQGIARRMTQRVVDDLEPVEVDEQNRALPMIAARCLEREAQQLVEHGPVWQIGQVVVRGEIPDALFGSLLLLGAVKIFQRERNIRSQSLQNLNELRGKCIQLGRHEEENADSLAAAQQGQRSTRSRARDGNYAVKGATLPVCEVIVAYAGLTGAECGPRQSSSFWMRSCDSYPYGS